MIRNIFKEFLNKYRITPILKVEKDIITPSLIGHTVILIIMYVKSFKTEVVVFICNFI